MLDKKEIPPVGRSNNHGGFCFKGTVVDSFSSNLLIKNWQGWTSKNCKDKE